MFKLFTPLYKMASVAVLLLVAVGIMSACAGSPNSLADSLIASKNTSAQAVNPDSSFTFSLVPSPNITSCLPKAHGSATIKPGKLNDTLTVSVTGLAPSTGYDLFIIELPNKPFGVAWYQSDLQTDATGAGSVSVRGIFNKETFSVSLGDNSPTSITFSPTHQYHIGLWFNDPTVPFKLGCEPGQSSPIVTPFNGQQNAGIQVLNTSNFPDNAGPLSHVS